ncbi:hypothetical protein [Acinetobacter calcoaceticus]|uniref:hypothetical protein n=1 Tax=Acinetobacter calcoaceticus TaxID=471 RepID=UPI00124FC664|nr:hypothetical protein [Acinetobacter calcoaceticus]
MEKMIYLDMNVFRAIKNKEQDYDYLYAKINNLKKLNFTFPYSAAHLEEVAKLSNNRFFLKLIDKISNGYSYRVGDIPKSVAKENCKTFYTLYNNHWVLNIDKEVYLENLLHNLHIILYQNDKDKNLVFSTKIQNEDIDDYYKRVVGDLNSTDTAERANIASLGSRNRDSQREKNIPDYFETSDDIRKRFNINVRLLSNMSPKELFKNTNFVDFLRTECFKGSRFALNNIPKGQELLNYHCNKEVIFHEIITSFEIVGYAQEKNNKDKTIRGFTHDISHAIYGSSANFFITNDKAFSKKLKALFYFLEIPCEILKFDDFINYDFSVLIPD